MRMTATEYTVRDLWEEFQKKGLDIKVFAMKRRVLIRYSPHSTCVLKLTEAQAYLNWLRAGNIGLHFNMKR